MNGFLRSVVDRLLRLTETSVAKARILWARFQIFFASDVLPRLEPLIRKTGEWIWRLREAVRGRERKIIVRTAVVGLAAFVLLVGGVFVKYLTDRSEISTSLIELKQWMAGGEGAPEKPPILILAADGRLLGEYLPEKQSRLTLNACSSLVWLNHAAVSAEDRAFYEHGGVSWRGVGRAMMRNIVSLSVKEGGGTITQQLARNLFTSRRTPGLIRKIYETFAAYQIEGELSKKEILCLYLNKIYMGEGRIGAEEASYFYFRKPPNELSAAEAAMIVGLFPSPARYSPLNNIRFSMAKQKKVLDAMVRDGHLKEPDVDRLVKAFMDGYRVVLGEKGEASPGTVGAYGASRQFRTNIAPDVNETSIRFLRESISEQTILDGGLKVYTTIDYARQIAALSAVRQQVEGARALLAKGSAFAPAATRHLTSGLNGVLVSVDPSSGGVRAVVGGYSLSYDGAPIDRAWVMKRQPGSAIKGFLYATALDEEVIHEDDEVVDEAVAFGSYRPKNWYPGYKGKITLRAAVAQSVNTVAVKTLHSLGTSKFRSRMAQTLRLDFLESRSRFPDNLSLALGSGEVTPVELALLYAPLLNGGHSVRPRLVTKITGPDGDVLWEETPPSKGDSVLSEEACESAIRLLQSVVEESGTAEWIARQRTGNGTFLPFPLAGKSGTVEIEESIVQKYRGMRGVHDAWFVALVPGEVSVTWVGHDDGAPFPGAGSTTAGGAWVLYAQAALLNRIHGNFPGQDGPSGGRSGGEENKPEKKENHPGENPGNSEPPIPEEIRKKEKPPGNEIDPS